MPAMSDLISRQALKTIYQVPATTADRWEVAGVDSNGVPFPKRLHLGRRVFYLKAEVDAWATDRVQQAITERTRVDTRKAAREAVMPRRRLNP